jgi:molybdate transport system permease protein
MERQRPSHRQVTGWAPAAGPLLLSLPLLVLIAGAIVALFLGVTPAQVAEQAGHDAVRQAIWLSLETTLISLLVIVVFGGGLALAIYRTPPWLSSCLEVIVTLPAIMPPSVAGIALLLAFGRQGLLGQHLDAAGIKIAFTPVAVVFAQTFVAAPFFVREVATALRGVDPDILDAARIDGARSGRLASSILFPLALPFAVSGAVLAWARAVGEFGATILFAGNMPGSTQTVPLAIYLGFESDLEQAKALAVILMLVAILVLVLLRVLLRRQMSFAH